MGLYVPQLLSEVIRPALARLEVVRPGTATDDAERLMLMIAAHESGFRFIRQVKGPAIGLWQMEPPTYNECWRWLEAGRMYGLVDALESLSTGGPNSAPEDDEMCWNLRFAAAMARVNLLRLPGKLPSAHDVPAMAAYAKKFWNTALGKATTDDYARAYEQLVLPVIGTP